MIRHKMLQTSGLRWLSDTIHSKLQKHNKKHTYFPEYPDIIGYHNPEKNVKIEKTKTGRLKILENVEHHKKTILKTWHLENSGVSVNSCKTCYPEPVENFGGTEDSRKNMKPEKKEPFGKLGGARIFKKNSLSRKNGHSKISGVPRTSRKA